MSDKKKKKFEPVIKSQPSLKVQIPNTAEGRAFLEQLKQLLAVEELPFVQSCPSDRKHTMSITAGSASAAERSPGATSYALDLRLEQEGFPP